MDIAKPDPGTLNTESLPTPELLARDLKEIVHDLQHWQAAPLTALRSLPSIKFSRADRLGLASGPTSNVAIRQRILGAVKRLPDASQKHALSALMSFQTPNHPIGERQEVAAEALSLKTESFRKGPEGRLLEDLAIEMFRGELAWTLFQFEPSPPRAGDWSINGWLQLLEFERTVKIDSRNHRRQTWATRMRMRAIKADLPLLVTSQRWSGAAHDDQSREPGEIRIIAPPSRPLRPASQMSGFDPPEPSLLQFRPAPVGQLVYGTYLWDLGDAKAVGEEFEHCWEQTLLDEVGSFTPYIGFATESWPSLSKIRLRAKLPPALASNVVGVHLTAPEGYVATTYTPPALSPAEPPQQVRDRDPDGFFTYEPVEIRYPDAYELRWGNSQPARD